MILITEVCDYEDKKFIVIWCPGGEGRPYASPKTMKKDNKEKINYIRKNSSTIEPTDDEVKDLYTLANKVPFDDRVNHHAELTDLNFTLIKEYLHEIGSDLYARADSMDFQELCTDMDLISTLPEYVKPKNVALMFFNSSPEKFFPYAQIDVVQFPEGVGGDKIIEQTFKGPLHEQLRAALRYIRNMILTEKIVKYPDRAEADRFFNWPYAAIEEALANAVYHKGYDEREPIEVRVEKEIIEIISHPGPDRSVTMDDLKKYKARSRRYRNRRIGDYLKELHLTEGRNTGFKKIVDALETNGSPRPEFETDEGHTYFISRFYIHEHFYEEGDLDGESVKDLKTDPKTDPKTNPKTDPNPQTTEVSALMDTDRQIIALIETNPMITRQEIADYIGLSLSGIKYAMRTMTKEGVLHYEGSSKNGRWIIDKDL